MLSDEHGLPVSSTSETALGHYDQAIHELLHFRAEVDAEANAALEEDPAFAMGNVLAAYLGLLTTEPDDARAARERFALFRSSDPALSPREHAHVEAAQQLLDGDFLACGALLGQITEEHPRDALALIVGHQSTSSPATPARSGTESAEHCRRGTRTSGITATCSACTPSGWRRRGTTTGRSRWACAPSNSTPGTCGAYTPWCTPTRCRAASVTAWATSTPGCPTGRQERSSTAHLVALLPVRAGGR